MSQKLLNLFKIIIVIFLLGLTMLLCGRPLATGILYAYDAFREETQWREKTLPLSQDVKYDICMKFALLSDDPRCQPGVEVYAPEFFDVIRNNFMPHDGVWATYDDVQKKLGTYQYNLEPKVTTGDGITYFRVWYDLQGDRIYPIVMFFYEDGELWRLIADVGD